MNWLLEANIVGGVAPPPGLVENETPLEDFIVILIYIILATILMIPAFILFRQSIKSQNDKKDEDNKK